MIIGIDLGTTNSLCAYFSEGESHIIPNRLGEALTPSVVSVDEAGVINVGKVAREKMLISPDSAASVFKRTMGTNKKYNLSGLDYSSEELSSFIIKYLKEDAEKFLGEEITEAVISVPAYFNDDRRKATKRAGELAGLKVERIISEPTAAALAYGIEHKDENTKFLVFDLGGGTFDVSILELYQSIVEVRAVAGDNYLGGEDFTNVLIKIFCDRNSIKIESLSLKEQGKLKVAAENCKIQFSESRKGTFIFEVDGNKLESKISEEEYEKECEELLDKIRQPLKLSLSDAKIKTSDIDMVVLVGGATKLPLIQRYVSKLFKKFPNTSVDPDKAVALGAAVQGAMKERNKEVKEIILTDVCPFTLGTEVAIEIDENRYESGHYCPIIERNTVIPASRTETLYTIKDFQKKLRIKVLQGESRFSANNLLLGELEIDIPRARAGEEPIKVTYTYDINSILEIEVTVVSTGNKVKKVLKMQNVNLSDEEINKRLDELSYLKIPPREQEANRLLLLQGERLYEESTGAVRMQIEREILSFEQALDSQDKDRIAEKREELKKYFENLG